MTDDRRYPYNYACDFVRGYSSEWNAQGMKAPTISRSQAAAVMGAFEAVFGLSHEDMAKKLADYANA